MSGFILMVNIRILCILLFASILTAADYRAQIRRTTYGVAHITARDFGGLGFGEGYAQAEDHVCTIADRIVKARGERARYFGAGPENQHIASDVTAKALRLRGRATAQLQSESKKIRDWFEGFAAGYNDYLRRTPVDRLPRWCRGADWVTPVTAADLVAASESTFVQSVPWGAPPDAGRSAHWPSEYPAAGAGASNGWALGRELSAGGGGMLLANPHYPWVGANRFWEKHLVIPGKLNVYGVNLIGLPGVVIGFNDSVAWTHTISAARSATFYRLKLAPGKPAHYLYDGKERPLTSRQLTVEVRNADPVKHTVWFSHYGPVLSLPALPWTRDSAVTVRDVGLEHGVRLQHWLRMAQARSLKELQQAHAETPGLGPVNTIATGKKGVAWYIDSAPVPQLRDEAFAEWRKRLAADKITKVMFDNGLILLDGSDSRFEWTADANAPVPGIVPFARKPQLERADYVFNANDSYWLANSKAPLDGPYSPLHGAQRSPVSPRTRNNDLTLSNLLFTKPAGPDGKFTLDELGDAVLSNVSLMAALVRPTLLDRCRQKSMVRAGDQDVDLTEACRVLANWDDRFDLDSRGAVLFREFISRYPYPDLLRRGRLFAVDFNPQDPVNTPRELADADFALENLAHAVLLLRSRNIPLDVPLGEMQYADKAGRRMPVHGGQGGYEGILNLQVGGRNTTTLEPAAIPAAVKGSRFLRETGYPIVHGSSFVMVLEFAKDGPKAKAFLTYGQSGDPESPHFTDQTELFAKKQWRPILFREAEIRKHVERTLTLESRSRAAEAR